MADAIQNVLFLCTGKSARSLFVGPLLNRAGAGRFLAHSAGSRPKGEPHPMALTVLSEHGFYSLSLRSRSWTEFSGPDAAKMDLIITVCDNVAGENCPVWPGRPIAAHWGIKDPAAVEGEGQHAAFETALYYLNNRISLLLALRRGALPADERRKSRRDHLGSRRDCSRRPQLAARRAQCRTLNELRQICNLKHRLRPTPTAGYENANPRSCTLPVQSEAQKRESAMNFRTTFAALLVAAGSVSLVQGCSSENAPSEPRSSGTSGVVFTADERGNSISVIDLRTSKVETTPISVSPHNLQTSADGRSLFAVGSPAGEGGHMANAMDGPGRLLGFDAAAVSRGSVFNMAVGRRPAHVIVDPQGARAFVTNAGDNAISVIDLARRQTVKSIAVGKSPHGLRMSPDGKTIYLANTGEGTVSVIDVLGLVEIARIPVGKAPVQVAFTPDGRHCYVSLRDENSVAVVDTSIRRMIAKIRVGPGPIQVFALPSGREVYVANQGTEAVPGNIVSVIDTTSRKVIANIVTGAGAHGVVVSNSGDRVLISNSFANTVSVIDPVSRKVVGNVPVASGPGGITFRAAKD